MNAGFPQDEIAKMSDDEVEQTLALVRPRS